MPENITNKVNSVLRTMIEIGRDPLLLPKIIDKHYAWMDIQRIQNWTVNFILLFAKTDLNALSDGAFFDRERKDLKEKVQFHFDKRVPEGLITKEKLENITRKNYAKLSQGLLRLSEKAKDTALVQSYRGIAWSVLAKDANEIFAKNSGTPLNSGWKDNLWRMINVSRQDTAKINAEIDKFASKDPAVFVLIPISKNPGQSSVPLR